MVADVLAQPDLPVFVIPGELDISLAALPGALQAALQLHFVHQRAASLCPGMVIAGFGGRLSVTNRNGLFLHYADWEARHAFEHLQSSSPLFQNAACRILLFATPLQSQRLDVDYEQHTGRAALNTICRRSQPQLICCAGPHHSRGFEIIDGTTVVNPGSLAQGSYAVVAIEGERIDVQLGQLPEPVERSSLVETVA